MDFSTAGLYSWNGTAWTRLSTSDAGTLSGGDLLGNTSADLAAGFAFGMYIYDAAASAWTGPPRLSHKKELTF